jgi:hypothetical protein
MYSFRKSPMQALSDVLSIAFAIRNILRIRMMLQCITPMPDI